MVIQNIKNYCNEHIFISIIATGGEKIEVSQPGLEPRAHHAIAVITELSRHTDQLTTDDISSHPITCTGLHKYTHYFTSFLCFIAITSALNEYGDYFAKTFRVEVKIHVEVIMKTSLVAKPHAHIYKKFIAVIEKLVK